MSDHVQTRSFAELLASKLAEQHIHLDPAHLPADVSGADVWLGGDGTHLARTVVCREQRRPPGELGLRTPRRR